MRRLRVDVGRLQQRDVVPQPIARAQATVDQLGQEQTRLTEWLGQRTGDPAGDPLAGENVAPVIAWLLGPGARDVTGRVLEAGNGQISVPGTWQPGTPFPLPPLMSPAAADALRAEVRAWLAAHWTPEHRHLIQGESLGMEANRGIAERADPTELAGQLSSDRSLSGSRQTGQDDEHRHERVERECSRGAQRN